MKDKVPLSTYVEKEVADAINRLPNKSEFVRLALLHYLNVTCPGCLGRGVVPKGIAIALKRKVQDFQQRQQCIDCRKDVVLPVSFDQIPTDPEDEDHARMRQWLESGVPYCSTCYAEIPPCACGWRVKVADVARHRKEEHGVQKETWDEQRRRERGLPSLKREKK
jgi:hypothetical protein